MPRERVADDIVHAGNTSSASIPLALSRMVERGELKSGSPALLLGFGAGRCYAAQVITVPLAAPSPADRAWAPGALGPHGPPGAADQYEHSRQGARGMNEQEILAGIGEIVEEIAGVPADEVTPSKSFVDDLDDLDIDSLSMVEIAVAAQDKFGVEIPDDQLKDLTTVQDVVNYVSKNAGGSA